MPERHLHTLPADLPVPEDDGACDHLPGTRLPSVALPSTAGGSVDLSALSGRTVVFCYPRTGRPDQPGLVPGWDQIPGARGCTPQACAFRDHTDEIEARGCRLYGLSTQDTEYQKEAAARLHLPFALLSDADLGFARALRLPTFTAAGMVFIKRLTLIIRDAVIETVFYPVFPPDRSPDEVLAWLDRQAEAPSPTSD
ncbi:MAG: peroxiredoxin [Kiloniellales bacterium]